MGQWNMTIRGMGAHHNKRYPQDANRMLAEFVQKLKKAGHNITAASITHGAEDDVTDADAYLEMRDQVEGPKQE